MDVHFRPRLAGPHIHRIGTLSATGFEPTGPDIEGLDAGQAQLLAFGLDELRGWTGLGLPTSIGPHFER